jgi:hypothetical protein
MQRTVATPPGIGAFTGGQRMPRHPARVVTTLIVCSMESACAFVGSRLSAPGRTAAATVYSAEDLITNQEADAIRRKYFVPDCSRENDKVAMQECLKKYASSDSVLAQLDWLNPAFVEYFNSLDATEQKSARNDMIDDLLILSDHEFHGYIAEIYLSKAGTEIGFDAYTTLLSGTAALTTGGATPHILSGLAAFLTGTRTSIDKNVFAEQTAQSLINTMDTNRLIIERAILDKKDKPIGEYSLRDAALDLVEMHQEGSIVAAVKSLLAKTSEQQAVAELAMKSGATSK